MMLSERDRRTLEEANINLDDAASEIAELIRRGFELFDQFSPNALTSKEKALLQRGGAIGLNTTHSELLYEYIRWSVSEYITMTAQAYTLEEAADLLLVEPGYIQQCINERILYALTCYRGQVFPQWQFYNKKPLPGLDQVLKVISPTAHPIAIMSFFSTISPDLESPEFDAPLNPRDWLTSGYQVDEVIVLAREL